MKSLTSMIAFAALSLMAAVAQASPKTGQVLVQQQGSRFVSVDISGPAAEALYERLKAKLGSDPTGNLDVTRGESLLCFKETSPTGSVSYLCGFALDDSGKATPEGGVEPFPVIGVGN